MPASDTFDVKDLKPLCSLIKETAGTFNEDLLQHELAFVRNVVISKLADSPENLDKYFAMVAGLHQDAFPNAYALHCVALTIRMSTASDEAIFSKVVNFLTSFRRCMKHDRKCLLVLLGFEKEETNNLTTGEIIKEFKKVSRKLCVQ